MAWIFQSYAQEKVIPAAEQTELYFPLLKNKSIAVVTNQTGVIGKTHLVDSLFSAGFNIKKIFAPEHGFRGTADAGETIKDGKDIKTGIPIISLYGNNKKPTSEQIRDIDLILFDIQDVGVRFYTYISTLHYIMEAAAENGKSVIVLDRPNPNGHYIDGPVLDRKFSSFVGMHPVPVVYGMTIGEYALMINGEGWITKKLEQLKVIPIKHYTHQTKYELPIKPSPNLPNAVAVNLYPSICFFEGTTISEGRGTEFPFQVFGAPHLKGKYSFKFTPISTVGAKNPKYKGEKCYGLDLRKHPQLKEIRLHWLIDAYKHSPKKSFFNSDLFFDKLAGTDSLRKQIIAGWSEQRIKQTWQNGLESFKKIRANYLLYP